MVNKLSGWDDTIVALATPPGVGAIGLIRLSGSKSVAIINQLFPTKNLASQSSHTLHIGFLKDGNKILDETVIALFKAPTSYTGEDVVEINAHGSPFILQQIIDTCIKFGARSAKPGEFTQRAFLNGKLDLTQAEAVADLISSNTRASQKAALHAMRGGFSENMKEMREKLLQFSALIELELDFSQEDVEFADRKKIHELIDHLTQSTQQLIHSFQVGNVIKNGVSVAIVGKPNAGKSTLLNTLLNENRAIVSETPGTTRDTIEEAINIGGILFRLVDTAGIREHTTDLIENAGIERSLEEIKKADLVLYLFDVKEAKEEIEKRWQELERRKLNFLIVGNKIDEAGTPAANKKFSRSQAVILISAKQKLHIDVLKEKMVDAVLKGQVQIESAVITNARHYSALKEVARALSDIKAGLNNKISADLLALDIRQCLHYLGEITGEITTEDQLDYIFSKFCIGNKPTKQPNIKTIRNPPKAV